jgi:hypothetical protein
MDSTKDAFHQVLPGALYSDAAPGDGHMDARRHEAKQWPPSRDVRLTSDMGREIESHLTKYLAVRCVFRAEGSYHIVQLLVLGQFGRFDPTGHVSMDMLAVRVDHQGRMTMNANMPYFVNLVCIVVAGFITLQQLNGNC